VDGRCQIAFKIGWISRDRLDFFPSCLASLPVECSNGAGGNYTVHVTGNNSRVNIDSTDRSTNVVVEGDVFGNLTAVLRKEVREGPELDRLLAAVEERRAKQKSPGF